MGHTGFVLRHSPQVTAHAALLSLWLWWQRCAGQGVHSRAYT